MFSASAVSVAWSPPRRRISSVCPCPWLLPRKPASELLLTSKSAELMFSTWHLHDKLCVAVIKDIKLIYCIRTLWSPRSTEECHMCQAAAPREEQEKPSYYKKVEWKLKFSPEHQEWKKRVPEFKMSFQRFPSRRSQNVPDISGPQRMILMPLWPRSRSPGQDPLVILPPWCHQET